MLEIAVTLQFVLILILFMDKSFDNKAKLDGLKAQEKLNNKVFEGFNLFDQDLKMQSDLNKIFSEKINDLIVSVNAIGKDLNSIIEIVEQAKESQCINME